MPMVGGKKYPYTDKGIEAANKAKKAQARAMGSKDKSSAAQRDRQRALEMAINEVRSRTGKPNKGGSLKNLPNKKNMPYKVGEEPKVQRGPYRPGTDKRQMLKADAKMAAKKDAVKKMTSKKKSYGN